MTSVLYPCDILLVRSSSWISRAIRFCTRRIGEGKTVASHVGVIVSHDLGMQAVVVEALSHVKRHTLRDGYGSSKCEFCVFRPLNLTATERAAITRKAESYVGRDYGYFKILLHLLDYCLDGAYFFRRLGRMDRYPICSYVVASAFKAAGKDFGVSSFAASPDDIWDFVTKNPAKYRFIWQRGAMYK